MKKMKVLGSTLVTAFVALLIFAGVSPSFGFGSIESPTLFGQHSEHQHVTEALQVADPRWDNLSLQLVAGNSGNYGGVAAPDRITDSSLIPIVGLGPGYKHCDDGDYMDGVSYSQSRSAANENFNVCIRYYQELLRRAVIYAGTLVIPVVNSSNVTELQVATSVFAMTSGATVSPDSVCKYRYSLTPDRNPKCDVINGIGRALHLAEDVWAHSNWGDLADPTKPISTSNPPGLGNTTVPPFLRFPSTALVSTGVISGCDDSASKSRCTGRIGHSVIAKDNGVITQTTATSTKKYPRSLVVVNGVSNFERAVTGAKLQAASTVHDFELEVLNLYGATRGAMIMSVLQNDTLASAETQFQGMQTAPVALSATVSSAQTSALVSLGSAYADPTADAAEGSFNKLTDPDEASLGGVSETIPETEMTGPAVASSRSRTLDSTSDVSVTPTATATAAVTGANLTATPPPTNPAETFPFVLVILSLVIGGVVVVGTLVYFARK